MEPSEDVLAIKGRKKTIVIANAPARPGAIEHMKKRAHEEKCLGDRSLKCTGRVFSP